MESFEGGGGGGQEEGTRARVDAERRMASILEGQRRRQGATGWLKSKGRKSARNVKKCGGIQGNAMQCNAMYCYIRLYIVMQCNLMQFNAMQFNAMQFNGM